ncbi:hypothetical protein ACO2Q0_21520 [Phenylobacterium sp. VNQ135]|uniref:hypothetical protein n=1 Tax=Phenylobacterium sp. VNQ135 TaxID=3400922 RepID=UPI003C0C60E3
MTLSRRDLGASSLAGLACAVAPPARATSGDGWRGADVAWLQAVLERFAGLGDKASGGPGDDASGAWLEGELGRIGYACRRQAFEVPFFEPHTTTLASGTAQAPSSTRRYRRSPVRRAFPRP